MNEINEKWDEYRCNPLIMPIAGYIKRGVPDPIEATNNNFQDCATRLMNPIVEAGVNMPTKPILGVFGDTIESLNTSVYSVFAVLLYRFRLMMLTVLQSLSNSFSTVTDSTNSLGLRVQYIMKRLGGVMTSIVYQFASIVKLQESSYKYSLNLTKTILGIGLGVGLFNTPVMIFTTSMIALLKLDGIKFCFHPDSIITLSDGRKIKAKYIAPGHVLEDGSYCTTSFLLKPQGKKFVKIGSIMVTEDHLIYDRSKNEYVEAKHHSKSSHYECNEPEYLVCWNTTIGQFEQEGVIFKDYEGNVIHNHAEGLIPSTKIPVWTGENSYRLTAVSMIQLGDTIGFNKTRVLGVVKTRIESNQKNMLVLKHRITGEKSTIYHGRNTKFVMEQDKETDYLLDITSDFDTPDTLNSPYLYTFITDKGSYRITEAISVVDYERTNNE